MRISSHFVFDTAATRMGSLQEQIARTQQQIATNKRMISAADDPIASARVLEVNQSQSLNEQYGVNRANARSSLAQVEGALGSVTTLLQDTQSLVVSARNGTLNAADRKSIATQVEGWLQNMLGLANTADGAGGYLFAGFKSTTVPFTRTATGADYHGDSGQRELQVGSTRNMAISDSGAAVFESSLTGNGTFATAPDSGNVARGGTGVISSGTVSNAAQLTGHDYTIQFAASAGVTTYTVLDNTTGAPVTPGPMPFQAGQLIEFDGMAMKVEGAPANGDSFTVKPSERQSVFQTMTDLVKALRADVPGAAGTAALSNELKRAGENLGSALDNVLSVRSSVGSRLKELDYLDSAGEDLNVQYSTTLSELQDVDMAKAISDFTQQQITLEAAQKSFKVMSGLSLFNFL